MTQVEKKRAQGLMIWSIINWLTFASCTAQDLLLGSTTWPFSNAQVASENIFRPWNSGIKHTNTLATYCISSSRLKNDHPTSQYFLIQSSVGTFSCGYCCGANSNHYYFICVAFIAHNKFKTTNHATPIHNPCMATKISIITTEMDVLAKPSQANTTHLHAHSIQHTNDACPSRYRAFAYLWSIFMAFSASFRASAKRHLEYSRMRNTDKALE